MNPFIAILLAGLAGWIFGAIWYMALGRVWQAALGMDPDACKDHRMPLAPMLVSLLGVTLIDGGHWILAVTLEAVVLKALT